MKTIRWGVIGPGRIAHKFVQDLRHVPGSTLTAVASRSLDRAKAFADEYGAPHAYGSYEELLNCPELDVVYIASPHIGHHEHTLLCLKAGIPVVCEKPFAMNAILVEEMIQTAQAHDTYLMEALWSRFMPTTLQALSLVQQGAIGEVLGVKADFGFKGIYDTESRLFNPKLGGGALLDIGIYPVFWSYCMLGKPTTLKASACMSPTGVDASTGMVFTYEGGQFAFLDCTFMARTNCEAFVYGTEGIIKVHGRWHESQALTVERYDQTPETIRFDRETWGYDYEIAAVAEDLRAGRKQNADWSLQNSRDLIQLLDQIRAEIGLVYPDFDL